MLLRACFYDKHICELQQKMVGTEKFRQSTGEYNRFISLNETNLPKVSHNSYHISLIFFILQHLTFPKHLMRKVIYSWIYFFFIFFWFKNWESYRMSHFELQSHPVILQNLKHLDFDLRFTCHHSKNCLHEKRLPACYRVTCIRMCPQGLYEKHSALE